MVGIVIVSHSFQLAQGVRELAVQMVQGKVSLAVAAGIDDPDNPLGTDAMQVYQAIASVYSDDGVLVLMDLGSALLSAEMALEFLAQEQRDKVHLCEAPLVEGTMAATVAAASGSNIEQVIAEARGALVAKATQLGIVIGDPSFVIGEGQKTQTTKEIRLFVSNRLGLHARPSAQFVATAARFQSQIKVRNLTKGTGTVRGDSINQVTTLGVRQGHQLAITATGSDADEALAALQALFENNFGEDGEVGEWGSREVGEPVSGGAQEKNTFPHLCSSVDHLQGIPACLGVAIAPIFQYHSSPIPIQQYHVNNIEPQLQRLLNAIQAAQQETQALLSQSSTQIGDAEAAIFDAHLLFLEDPVLMEAVQRRILERQLNAEGAWQEVIDELANNYRSLEDSYLQERVADVVDVGQRVLRLLVSNASVQMNFSEPVILVASDLTPSNTAMLDPTKVLGICTTSGSVTSHSVIIARSLGIPEVVGLPTGILQLANGTLVALDGETGEVWIEPQPDVLAALEAKREARQVKQQQTFAAVHEPAITSDGRQINVFANIGSILDVKVALNNGAEGVGLFRTEFLYLQQANAPSEEEQLAIYQEIASVLETRPLIIRTLDVGGDKPLPYLDMQSETNPFLGWRGIRMCLARPDIFKTQLRAICRASFGHQIKVMFPMIATVEEVQTAKAILAEVQGELRQAGIPFDEAMSVGIMVEVPSAVAIAEQLATEVNFFSIGTNDLCQYVMACDRTNPRVASLADALHPAVLRMIEQTVQAAHQAGIWVGLCGELAADRDAVPILLGLGLDEVSLNPQAIPAFKSRVAQLTMAQAQAFATSALQQGSAAKVREMVTSSVLKQI
ncbi:phosphoenolpyruvate--protein phosphotransferase [Iningainema tapete]|uniref:Phosphocarrier protein HPr n=1 Tax=Iningainema tapete BLCC-T55 TaxID=2748662 RepID=A0A8J6XAJ3_9CYAN|nr:phosphoenolpyruvate--protein phosphotransferase [Iningainema tapete BLCC-T55]